MPKRTGAGSIGIGLGVGPRDGEGGAPSPPPPAPTSGPTALVATSISANQINLGWTAAQDTETSHVVERSPDGVGSWTQIAEVFPSTVEEYQDTNLTQNTQYFYRVAGKNAGGLSPYSNVADATTETAPTAAPAKIENLVAVATGVDIALTWDPDPQALSYKVERSVTDNTNFVQIAETFNASYNDIGLAESTKYVYRVRGSNTEFGNGPYSDEVSETTGVGQLDPQTIFGSALKFWGDAKVQGANPNILAQSEDVTVSPWSQTGGGVVRHGPDDIEGAASSDIVFQSGLTGLLPATLDATISFRYEKASVAGLDPLTYGRVYLQSLISTTSVNVEWQTGTLQSTPPNGSGQVIDEGTHFRVIRVISGVDLSVATQFRVVPFQSAGGGGDTSARVTIDQFQLEAGSAFSGYQQTTATRGGVLEQIDDNSTNANHATQGTQAAMALVTTGLDGNPEWLFDGVDDFYDMTSPIAVSNATDFHIWCLMSVNGAALTRWAGATGGSTHFIQVNASNQNIWRWSSSNTVITAAGSVPRERLINLRTSHIATGDLFTFLDGVDITDGTPATAQASTEVSQVSENATAFNGIYRLFVCVEGTITAQQISDMDDYVESLLPPINPVVVPSLVIQYDASNAASITPNTDLADVTNVADLAGVQADRDLDAKSGAGTRDYRHGIVNGLNVITPNGANNVNIGIVGDVFTSDEVTILSVQKNPAAWDTTRRAFYIGDSTGVYRGPYSDTNARLRWDIGATAGSSINGPNTNWPVDAVAVTAARRDAVNIESWIDGVSQGQSAKGAITAGSEISWGANNSGGNRWTGDLCEVVCFDDALDNTTIRQIEKFLANKWGITLP